MSMVNVSKSSNKDWDDNRKILATLLYAGTDFYDVSIPEINCNDSNQDIFHKMQKLNKDIIDNLEWGCRNVIIVDDHMDTLIAIDIRNIVSNLIVCMWYEVEIYVPVFRDADKKNVFRYQRIFI